MKPNLSIALRLTDAFKRFTSSQKTSGILLLVVSVISLVLANSKFSGSYLHFWENQLHINGNGHFSIIHMINDGLMTIFFLLVGLEIKRELIDGELKGFQRASLPVAAAIGGMLVPALLYNIINHDLDSADGWGIPMATDIAFAIGIISILGNKVSDAGKVLITALAVVDDLGAVIVIALFYSASIKMMFLFLALAITIILLIFNYKRLQNPWLYILPGLALWYFVLRSGIHSTIAGVILATTIPFHKSENSLLIKMESKLHTIVNFFIMPLFAMANTAILIQGDILDHLKSPEGFGISIGLILGKPMGIVLMVVLMVAFKISKLPKQISYSQLVGLGFLGGIGFTMSMFISMLAFKDIDFITNSKIAIVFASLLAGLIGFSILKFSKTNTND
ncbi:MAG: Na+/H+ antiporter NhaA [Bacteroidetes bacterium]|nr:Na+/H+ antiporter NhaA [Bacteroidota bacterium]